ncbi:MAG: RluA family pseudouridine synthase [Bacteroides sp.]|nr:RluA family pseudouridine synthase [Prevotella sp.]MCM1407926.1 RluA family pseudouridine synthase [Treponema brennaborense]MCM1469668.1 RluA family pseudouridine synthase [Bacteroides sp.]
MIFRQFSAKTDDDGRRFDRILRKLLPDMPLPHLYKNIRTGKLRLNGRKTPITQKVRAGDSIDIAEALLAEQERQIVPDAVQRARNANEDTAQSTVSAAAMPLQDIFKNEHIRIINKPYNIPVHSAKKTNADIASAVKYDGRSSLSFVCAPMHRLDRMTTGALAISQSITGARWFSQAISRHEIEKTYLAVVENRIDGDITLSGIIAADKNISPKTRFASVSVSEANGTEDAACRGGKHAVTHLHPLAVGTLAIAEAEQKRTVTLAEIRIETGRTHQIRAQCAHAGFALLGDTAYGARAFSLNGQSLFLHAYTLRFPANPLGIPRIVRADIPQNFRTLLKKCLQVDGVPFYNTIRT